MNKKEAADALGVSTKTIERLVGEGKLNPAKVHGPTGLQNEFDQAEVEALRRERATPIREARPVGLRRDATEREATSTLARRESVTDVPEALAQLFGILHNLPVRPQASAVAIESKTFLTIKEAAELSGLGVSHLEGAIEAKQLKVYKLTGVRGRRIKRQDLDGYTKKL